MTLIFLLPNNSLHIFIIIKEIEFLNYWNSISFIMIFIKIQLVESYEYV